MAHSNEKFVQFKSIYSIKHRTHTMQQIADECKISKPVAERWRRKFASKKQQVLSDEFVSEIYKVKDEFTYYFLNKSTKEIQQHFRIGRTTIVRWARLLNLKKPSGKWTRTNHPRGMLNKKHTAESIRRSVENGKVARKNPNAYFHSEELKQKRSDAMVKARKDYPNSFLKTYSKSLSGERMDIKGVYFRSSWEANYARYLNFLKDQKKIFKWEFESETFWFLNIKRGVRSYKPDFKIWETEQSKPYFVEIKGWLDAKSKTKIKRMSLYYPDVELRLVDRKIYIQLKKIAPFIKNWEYDSCIRFGAVAKIIK